MIAPGACADLVVWDAETPAEIVYWLGAGPERAVLKGGRLVGGPPSSPPGPNAGRRER